VAVAAQQAVHFVGMPEGFFPLAHATLYLATAPKSNSVGSSYSAALADVLDTRNDPVPLHLRNAPTRLMRHLRYGEGYHYAHDDYDVEQLNLPPSLADRRYYVPRKEGAERNIAEREAEKRRRPE
jgi:putative ATPase